MSPRRSALIATLLLTLPLLSPLAASEPAFDGDVVVNGAFRDWRPQGHPLKFYANDANVFVAYDWTTTASDAARIAPATGSGLRMIREPGLETTIQQHFNGSEAPAREMTFHGWTVTGRGDGGATSVRVDLRYVDAAGAKLQASRSIALPASGATVRVSAADLGLSLVPRDHLSVRIWLEGPNDAILERVEVHATNGIDPRNVRIMPAGDDALEAFGGVLMQQPGADGLYSFRIDLVDSLDQTLRSRGAVLCIFSAEDALAADLDPARGPGQDGCVGATLTGTQTRPYRVADGDGWRFDIPASLVKPKGDAASAFFVWGSVQYEGIGAYPGPDRWLSAWFNVAREWGGFMTRSLAPDWQFEGTPVLFDRDSNDVPDGIETDDLDGFSVIVTPLYATTTPVATVVTPSTDNAYHFDVQVYAYPRLRDAADQGGAGAPLTLDARGVAFGLFDGNDLAQPAGNPDFTRTPLWRAEAHHVSQVDATTYRVRVPQNEVPANAVLGAWAYYDVDGVHERETIFTRAYGPSDTAFDFYSAIRTAARESMLADGMRNAGTPLLMDRAHATRDATVVVRMLPDVDALTPLDGTLVVEALDGHVSFEYATVLPESRTRAPTNPSHALAIYDAAGLLSDGNAPRASDLEHAEWVGSGTLQPNGWYRVDVPLSAFDAAKGAVVAWAKVDDLDAPGINRDAFFNLAADLVAPASTSAARKLPATPLVVLDAQLGISKALASTLAAQPTALFSVTNPVVNPGFELDMAVEGQVGDRSGASGSVTTPPWYFRLNDEGTGQPTNPKSTHEVVPAAGRALDKALRIKLDTRDAGKGLMLGQRLGLVEGVQALVWEDAKGVSFDVRRIDGRALQILGHVHWLDDDGVRRIATASRNVPDGLGWQRIDLDFAQPVEGRLVAVYLTFGSGDGVTFFLDNIVVRGATTTLGDARSDLADGHAMIIEPQSLAGSVQSPLGGVGDAYYVYHVHAVDYTTGAPRALPLAETGGRAFAMRTHDAEVRAGALLPIRGSDTTLAALVTAGSEPAPLVAPWAFFDAGDPYATLGAPFANQPVSGYYSPVKNALAGSTLADQMDYDATPVRLAGDVVGAAVQQAIALEPVPGGRQVRVTAVMPYVETTTVTVQTQGQSTRTFELALDDDAGNVVPGLVIADADLARTTITTTDTRFAKSVSWAGNRAPVLGALTVSPTPVHTDTMPRFVVAASDPEGGILRYAWTLDGADIGESGATFQLTPAVLERATGARTLSEGSHVVGVLVTDVEGASASTSASFEVLNRPTSVHVVRAGVVGHPYALVGETAQIVALANDPDNEVVSVVAEISLAGTLVRTVPLALTGALWSADVAGLAAGDHVVVARATDNASRVAASVPRALDVRENTAPTVELGEDATFDVGESFVFTPVVADPDARGVIIAWRVDGVQVATGPTFEFAPTATGVYAIEAVVTDAQGAVASDSTAAFVDDTISVAVDAVATGLLGEAEAIAIVTDDTGAPVANARVVFAHYHEASARALAAQEVFTDANGVARWRVPSLGPLHAPGMHRIDAHVTAGSRADAPVLDQEATLGSASFSIALLP